MAAIASSAGVPEITPLNSSMLSPSGSPAALKVSWSSSVESLADRARDAWVPAMVV